MIHNLNILIVDDELVNTILLEELVMQEGYNNFITFNSPMDAYNYALSNNVDMLITDYNMPELNGIDLLKLTKAIHPDLVSIMVTADNNSEMMIEALKEGVSEFLLKPIFPITFKLRLKNILEVRSALKVTKDFNKTLDAQVQEATKALKENEFEVLTVLSKAAEYKDPETASHIARVSHYSKLIAKEYGLSEEEQEIIFYASPLHDIGKIGILDSILLKPGKLTPQEFDNMKRHSKVGASILGDTNNPYLQAGYTIALTHHEKYNGEGYPKGLKAEEIPLYGRIVAIADVFDALTSIRPYKKAWSFEDATELLVKEKGSHFDPTLVEHFINSLSEIREIYDKFSENESI